MSVTDRPVDDLRKALLALEAAVFGTTNVLVLAARPAPDRRNLGLCQIASRAARQAYQAPCEISAAHHVEAFSKVVVALSLLQSWSGSQPIPRSLIYPCIGCMLPPLVCPSPRSSAG